MATCHNPPGGWLSGISPTTRTGPYPASSRLPGSPHRCVTSDPGPPADGDRTPPNSVLRLDVHRTAYRSTVTSALRQGRPPRRWVAGQPVSRRTIALHQAIVIHRITQTIAGVTNTSQGRWTAPPLRAAAPTITRPRPDRAGASPPRAPSQGREGSMAVSHVTSRISPRSASRWSKS